MKTLLKLVLAGVALGVLTGFATVPPAQLRREKLQQPREIDGYPCDKGYAFFYADGKLEDCAVSRQIGVGVVQLPSGSIISLSPDGTPSYVMMKHDAAVGEVECRGGNWLLGPSEGAMTLLYPSGKLKMCWLAKDQVVQGVPCMNGGAIFGDGAKKTGGVRFMQSGKLKSCTLAKDYEKQRRGEVFEVQ